MTELSDKKCVPCRGGVPPLVGTELSALMAQLSDWTLVAEHHIEKQYRFPNFADGLEFVNQIGAIAEAEGHHPDIGLSWGRVVVKIWTHKIDGLTESDFILAAKIDKIPHYI